MASTTTLTLNNYYNSRNNTAAAKRKYEASERAYQNELNKSYRPSSQVRDYQRQSDNALNAAKAMGNFKYDSKYMPKADEYLQKAADMKFESNIGLTDNPAYQQYRDMYVHNGQMAAQEAQAGAVAATGGYGSTAAQTAAQQTYNDSLSKLNAIVPDLYQQEFSNQYTVFQGERDSLKQLAAAYQSMDAQAYDEALSTWTNNFNQFMEIAKSYNEKYEYLDSAERAQYEKKLDGLYKLLATNQSEYQSAQSVEQSALGTYVDSRNQAAQLALQQQQLNETARHNRFAEAQSARAAKESASPNPTKTKNAEQFSSDLYTINEFSARKGTGEKKYKEYVATKINDGLNRGRINASEAAYLYVKYGLNQ